MANNNNNNNNNSNNNKLLAGDESPIWATPLPTRGLTKSASEADLSDGREWPSEVEDSAGGKSSSLFSSLSSSSTH